MSRLSATLAGVLLVTLSCKSEPGGPSDNGSGSQTAAVTSPVATTPPPSTTAPHASGAASAGGSAGEDAALTRSAVEELLQDWLAAQNSRSFESYTETYAQRFTGIKRIGSKMSRMDRENWLRDRQQMFPRIVRVEAKNPEISLLPRTASLRFEQYWTSANYEDRGTKQMTIVLEDGAPRIAREELLDSRIIGSAPASQSLVRIVHHFRGKDYLIIGDGATIETPELYDGSGTYVAFGAVDPGKVPGIADWQGRALRVFSASGKQCTASGGKIMGIAHALPHFSESGRWENEKVPTSARAQIIAEMSVPQYALEIESVAGDCSALVLGQAATQPPPEVAAETADETAKRLALAAFRRLPEYRREQRSLDEFLATTSDGATKATPQQPWIEYSPVIVSQRSFRLGKEHYVWLSYNTGAGCGGWDGGLAMLFRVELGPTPKATALRPPKDASYPTGDVTTLLHTQHAAQPRLLLHPTFSAGTELLDEQLQPTEELRFVSFDCPC